MCQHLGEYSAGFRSWGGDVPGYAQGCYYPGDEPGYRCKLTDEICDPDQCHQQNDAEDEEGAEL